MLPGVRGGNKVQHSDELYEKTLFQKHCTIFISRFFSAAHHLLKLQGEKEQSIYLTEKGKARKICVSTARIANVLKMGGGTNELKVLKNRDRVFRGEKKARKIEVRFVI